MADPREPRPAAPDRIAGLATLPLFHRLRGRRAIIAGDSDGALWKAELLAAAGAEVLAFSIGDNAGFAALAARISALADEGFGSLTLHVRAAEAADFRSAALAIGDFAEDGEAEAFRALALAAGAPVNIIDKPHLCDVQFGSIINRSPLLVAVSTDGAAPVLGQAIRTRIEALLPHGLRHWLALARDIRPRVQALGLPLAIRRRFWAGFTARALAASEGPAPDVTEAVLADLAETSGEGKRGHVSLVGAGPGDPDLLTLKAMRTLQSADVILFDDLVSPDVLDLARREATRISVGKVGHGPSVTQAEINRLIVHHALAGRNVVRLKSGDPMIFGRAGEEIAACEHEGVAVSIVPGISAAQGAAASLGISLTERLKASRVQFVTGHDRKGGLPDTIAWPAIADAAVTTVIYMARRTLPDFSVRAIAAGLAAETPAVAVLSATRADEVRIAGTIADLPAKLAAFPGEGPTLVVVGWVLAREPHAADHS
ncbi:MAG: siroheme synthase CysG [Proteobacteria bacterium]|nr:siroheme synthase CysG [Pseudomonadota bacterium]